MSGEKLVRVHAHVEGRVQGVGFRYFVAEQAQVLGITGWVRNRWMGTVETVAEGSRETLDRFVAALRRGPRMSYVSDLKVEWGEGTGEFAHFQIRGTG